MPQPQEVRPDASDFVFSRDWKLELQGAAPADAAVQVSAFGTRTGVRRTDVLHLRYSEQTPCFMILLKRPYGGPSSTLTTGNPLKTVDATHPICAGGDQQWSSLPRHCS
jgi:hypothetical protein